MVLDLVGKNVVSRVNLRAAHHRGAKVIDAFAQIRLFRKLKLESCARPGNRAGFLILCRWVERLRVTRRFALQRTQRCN
jgi:hypothetical protein